MICVSGLTIFDLNIEIFDRMCRRVCSLSKREREIGGDVVKVCAWEREREREREREEGSKKGLRMEK